MRYINVAVTSFGGLGLPPTTNFICPEDMRMTSVVQKIRLLLPKTDSRIIITNTRNHDVSLDEQTLQHYVPIDQASYLSLRISLPLCGGKGGFGSQLRAAGGRMSSRKKRDNSEGTSSNRNLDGRRLRTVQEAKSLAQYLSMKPELERKEKETRRQNWLSVISSTETQQSKILSDRSMAVDEEWTEIKEEASDRTKTAVNDAMQHSLVTKNVEDTARLAARQKIALNKFDQQSRDQKRTLRVETNRPSVLRSLTKFHEDDSDTDSQVSMNVND